MFNIDINNFKCMISKDYINVIAPIMIKINFYDFFEDKDLSIDLSSINPIDTYLQRYPHCETCEYKSKELEYNISVLNGYVEKINKYLTNKSRTNLELEINKMVSFVNSKKNK